MSLSYDPSKAESEFQLLAPGEYEAFISAVDHGFAQTSGNEKLTVNYKIRKDVDQEGGGQEIRFDNFVNTENALWRFHALNKALGAEKGATWADFKEWMHYIKGKAVKIVVKHEEASFGKHQGKTFAVVSGFKPSEVGGEMKIESPANAANSIGNTKATNDPFSGGGQIDIDDSDLPF